MAAIEQRRDQAAVVLESLRRLHRLDVLRIMDAPPLLERRAGSSARRKWAWPPSTWGRSCPAPSG